MLNALHRNFLVFSMLLSMLSGSIAAESKATADQAVAMVKKGVANIKKVGTEKAYAQITDLLGGFTVNDLYLVVYSLEGTVLAHGQNKNMVGKNMIGLKDIDGVTFIAQRMELAKKNDTFWQEYQFSNPVTKKIEPKRMYCEKLGDTVVCGGIYK